MQRIELSPGYEISRVIRGGWQLSGSHSASVSDDPAGDMIAFADAGITTFDCADIYTGVEELIGEFRARYRDQRGQQALDRIKVHTKFVPDLDILPRISKPYVEQVIDTSLRRLRMERLDLVQFHWWNYDVPRWLETAHWLEELRRAGKIDKIGGTNFDTRHMVEMIESGVPLASMQVQYSLLDRRPRKSHGRGGAQAWRRLVLLRHGRRRIPEREVAGRAGTQGRDGEPLAHQVPAGDRGVRRLGAVPGAAPDAARYGAAAQQRHRDGGKRRCLGVAERRGGHRRRAQPVASAGQSGDLRPCSDGGGSSADR